MKAKAMNLALAKFTFKSKRAKFYKDLAEALKDHGVLMKILQRNVDRLSERNDAEAVLFQLWIDRMDDCSFPEALRGTVPDSDVMILRASEASNSLAEGLLVLSMSINALKKMRGAVLKAIAEPAFVVVSSLLMAAVISVIVVPILTSITNPSTWPLIGQWLNDFVQFEMSKGPWVFGVAVAVVSLTVWSLPRWKGRVRVRADRYIPIYTLYRDLTGASFLVALAALMRTGCGPAEALLAIQQDASPWLSYHIDEVFHRLDSAGAQPAKAFATGVFNRQLTDRIEDFGDRSEFHVAIGKVGLETIEEVTETVVASTAVLNIILLIIGGLLTLFINVGVIVVANDAGTTMQNQLQQIHRH